MADTGEDREVKAQLEAMEAERFREAQRLATKTREANRRGQKLKQVVDPKLIPPGLIPKPPKRS
jgi:hypothetical protein